MKKERSPKRKKETNLNLRKYNRQNQLKENILTAELAVQTARHGGSCRRSQLSQHQTSQRHRARDVGQERSSRKRDADRRVR